MHNCPARLLLNPAVQRVLIVDVLLQKVEQKMEPHLALVPLRVKLVCPAHGQEE